MTPVFFFVTGFDFVVVAVLFPTRPAATFEAGAFLVVAGARGLEVFALETFGPPTFVVVFFRLRLLGAAPVAGSAATGKTRGREFPVLARVEAISSALCFLLRVER
jgi:hypothetical protein